LDHRGRLLDFEFSIQEVIKNQEPTNNTSSNFQHLLGSFPQHLWLTMLCPIIIVTFNICPIKEVLRMWPGTTLFVTSKIIELLFLHLTHKIVTWIAKGERLPIAHRSGPSKPSSQSTTGATLCCALCQPQHPVQKCWFKTILLNQTGSFGFSSFKICCRVHRWRCSDLLWWGYEIWHQTPLLVSTWGGENFKNLPLFHTWEMQNSSPHPHPRTGDLPKTFVHNLAWTWH
jgi:hypothetical protein